MPSTTTSGICRGCHCTEESACINTFDSRACHWIDEGKTLCSACFLGAQHEGKGFDGLTQDEVNFLRESNAIEGVHGYDAFMQAAYAWQYLKDQEQMTPGVVRKTHKVLMIGQDNLRPDERGYYRTIPVYIGDREAIPAGEIVERVENWCHRMNHSPAEEWEGLHVGYETIHPFVDGNGRTGRMFMNWHLGKNGAAIKIFLASERQTYYQLFK